MAEPEVVINDPSADTTPAADVDMGGADEAEDRGENGDGDIEASGLENIEPEVPERVTFLDYLKSPIIELAVGSGEEATTLYAHQGLLIQSPYFQAKIEAFPENTTTRRIDLTDDDLTATASFLEFLYKEDYFPTVRGQQLEDDPTIPSPDEDGVGLLRHARVYTLAQKFGLPTLSSLAHKKIHLTASTARGEIAYARYVYKHTQPADDAIRRPVAAFWAQRSHVLRHEAEKEFRSMCLEFPQFGFDVLSLVLDAQEKRTARSEASTSINPRKRPRASQGLYG